LVAELEYHSYF